MEGKAGFPEGRTLPKKIYKWPITIHGNLLIPVVFRNMQIKTKMRHHFTPIKMAITWHERLALPNVEQNEEYLIWGSKLNLIIIR